MDKIKRMSEAPRLPTLSEVLRGIKRAQSNIFKPVTKESICYHYLPLLGAKSYVELSLAVGAPRGLGRLYSSIGLPEDMNTVHTAAAASCLGLYLYNRPTFGGSTLQVRAFHSVFHSTLFVFGSLLSWAFLARAFNKTSAIRTLLIFGSSFLMLNTARHSLDHVDNRLGNTLGKK